MSNSNHYSLERLADRQAIRDALRRWVRAVDRREWPLVREAFHPDGTDNHGTYNGGVDGLIDWLTERHKTIEHCTHLLSDSFIEFSGPDTAVCETYCVAFSRYAAVSARALRQRFNSAGDKDFPDGAIDMVTNGRYVDVFERRNGEWRIARRTTVFDNPMMFPAPAAGPSMSPEWPVGKRDRTDPLWEVRSSVGLA